MTAALKTSYAWAAGIMFHQRDVVVFLASIEQRVRAARNPGTADRGRSRWQLSSGGWPEHGSFVLRDCGDTAHGVVLPAWQPRPGAGVFLDVAGAAAAWANDVDESSTGRPMRNN